MMREIYHIEYLSFIVPLTDYDSFIVHNNLNILDFVAFVKDGCFSIARFKFICKQYYTQSTFLGTYEATFAFSSLLNLSEDVTA